MGGVLGYCKMFMLTLPIYHYWFIFNKTQRILLSSCQNYITVKLLEGVVHNRKTSHISDMT